MFNSALKLIFRVTHIACCAHSSACYLGGVIASDVFFGVRDVDLALPVLAIFSGLLVISGVTNIILLKPKKIFSPEDVKVWKIAIYLKAALLLLVCPILNEIVDSAGGSVYGMKVAQLVFIVLTLIVSAYAKVHRDQKSVKMLKQDQL